MHFMDKMSKRDQPKVIASKLTFKGENRSPKPESVLGKRRTRPEAAVEQKTEEEPTAEIKILNGKGRISSSGTTIHGHGTEFMSQLSVNDAIVVTHPTSLQEETKIVRMVLSDTSIGISSAFSTDLVSTTPFRYIKVPKDPENKEEKLISEREKREKEEVAAFGTYASKGGSTFTYRVKKDGAYGGYKIVSESTSSTMSREELLDQRSKKKSDR